MKCADLISPPDYEGPYQHVRFSWGVQVVGKAKIVTVLSSGCDSHSKEPFCSREEMPIDKGRDFWTSLRKQGWTASKPAGFPRPTEEGSKLFKDAEKIETP